MIRAKDMKACDYPKIKDAVTRFQYYYPKGRVKLTIDRDQYEIELYRNKESWEPDVAVRNRGDSPEGWIPIGIHIWGLTEEMLDEDG